MKNLKVVLIGSKGVGKTTLKKVFFEEVDPEEILKNPLEPTYGIDISNYDFGNTIIVHDLAGQQLEDWLEHEHSVFYQTDLLLLILDATISWGENEQLWLRVYRVAKKHSKQIFFGIYFHKIDLLTAPQYKTLEQNIKTYPFLQLGFHTYLTSIYQDYFKDTLISVLTLLKQTIFPKNALYNSDIMKLSFLEQALKKTAIKFTDLNFPSNDCQEIVADYIDDMEKSGYLIVDKELNQIRITLKGRRLVEQYSSRIFNKLLEIQSEDSTPLLGFLLADKFGRQFFMYENIHDFFKKMFIQLGENVDPAMITGFFYAAQSFGDQIDEKGVNSIEFRGRKVQILIIMEENLFGNFFLDKTVILGSGIKEILTSFLKTLNHQFSQDINHFLSCGDLKLFDKLKNEIQIQINELNNTIKNNVTLRNKAQQIYTDLSQNREMNYFEKKEIKRNLFNFMLSEDEKKIFALKNICPEKYIPSHTKRDI
jgi:predicted transcriptional regulator